jgi:hypothetical protein
MNTPAFNSELEDRMNRIIGWYTVAASAKGAIPLPAASAAIVANNSLMVTHLSAASGQDVSLRDVLRAVGIVGTLNLVGKALFIEIAKTLGWGTGFPFATVLLCGTGATTAGLQTYAIGQLSLAIIRNGGQPLPDATIMKTLADSKARFSEFFEWCRQQNWSTCPA